MCQTQGKLELEWINNKKAKKNWDFYKHGHAFTTANETSNNVIVDENVAMNNTLATITNPTTTVPVCKSCLWPGHKYCSSRQYHKNKYYLAALAAAKANEEGKVVDDHW